MEADLWAAAADENQMHQVLMNLCVNAVDAIIKRMSDRNRSQLDEEFLIRLSAENVTIEKSEVQHHPSAFPGQFVMVIISDNGCGMDARTRERIFEPFFTTKPVDKGTGLGLSTVYGIIRQHQGWIDVWSALGQGTRFVLYLPRHIMDPAEVEADKGPVQMVGGEETILLVDDEAMIREFGQEVLEELGYGVILAQDGQEAVEIFERRGDDIDLVILDLTMPRLSGEEAMSKILALRPEARIIISSGHESNHHPSDLDSRPSPAAYVTKPYRPRDLAAAIREALDRK